MKVSSGRRKWFSRTLGTYIPLKLIIRVICLLKRVRGLMVTYQWGDGFDIIGQDFRTRCTNIREGLNGITRVSSSEIVVTVRREGRGAGREVSKS
jgi:hypothetical protein